MKLEEKASMPLAGGIANMGYQCGMLWGAALAAGAQAHRLYGPGEKAETAAVMASRELVESFHGHSKNEIDCLEISNLNMQGKTDGRAILKFFLKGGPIGCFRMSARYAPDVFEGINEAYAEEDFNVPPPPVSCASMFAKQMGASDLHTAMVAGFAGGIGFSGGGCGVLGAAIWLTGIMNKPVEMEGFSYSGTWVSDVIEKYLEAADYEFECAEVVGRKFENVEDHAEYLHTGGCSEIIDNLVDSLQEH